jgi:hypothetical protein
MVLAPSEVRRIVERVCARQDVLDACANRDLGYVNRGEGMSLMPGRRPGSLGL